jgi:hypothetical protein
MRWLKFVAKLFGRIVGGILACGLWYGLVFVITSMCMDIKAIFIMLLVCLCLFAVCALVGVCIAGVCTYIQWSCKPPLLDPKK